MHARACESVQECVRQLHVYACERVGLEGREEERGGDWNGKRSTQACVTSCRVGSPPPEAEERTDGERSDTRDAGDAGEAGEPSPSGTALTDEGPG